MTIDASTDAGRSPINAPDAPEAVGPYSHAVRHGDVLYCSGALPLDPDSGQMIDESVAAETNQCLDNLAAVCRAAGTDLASSVRLTIYTTRLESFDEINKAYGRWFPNSPPARVTVGVAALPKGASVELDAIVAVA